MVLNWTGTVAAKGRMRISCMQCLRRNHRPLKLPQPRRSYSAEATQVQARLEELRTRSHITQKANDWHQLRRTLITASDVASFLTRTSDVMLDYYQEYNVHPNLHDYDAKWASPWHSRAAVMKKKVLGKRNTGTIATRWGSSFEHAARAFYQQQYQCRLEQFGLLVHDEIEWLGASVDAVDPKSGTIIEIKCPFRAKEIILDSPPPLHYWIQVQIQLEVLKLPKAEILTCNFVKYASLEDYFLDPGHGVYAKGCFLKCVEEDQSEKWVYPPDHIQHESSLLKEWISSTTTHFSGRCYPRFWALTSYTIHDTMRNETWFRKILPTLRESYDELMLLMSTKDISSLSMRPKKQALVGDKSISAGAHDEKQKTVEAKQ